ncbi:uncharacterized protein LOC132193312 [Neocloeon triangulifer]|uniref:uncharacterized protein LOC132193312 n=1 Tax=Neocloeon triangulifer TaxID=2078957 RepID=UPI00286FA6DA|nr:uncharacterized protein LOC132193312 [Neocloeon triangulifer]
MPSKEQLMLSTSYPLAENTAEPAEHPAMRVEAAATAAFLSQDMEQLVCEIKENLRLSGFKHRPSGHSSSRRLSRASPYPTSFGPNCTCKEKCLCRRKSRTGQGPASSEDPYERLQELLRDGSLIKEAVRRLKIGLSPKQRYYYDDSDESTTTEFPPSAKFATCDS